jgi:polyisoprenoid-binding protein YceI
MKPFLPFPLFFAFVSRAVVTPAVGQSLSGTVIPGESHLSYTGSHPLHEWTGTSRAVSGRLTLDPARPESGRIEIEVPVESFDSGNANRDSNMLDGVDVDRYPRVRFVSERIEGTTWQTTGEGGSGRWQVHGSLTFHGRTRPVTIPVEVDFDGKRLSAKAAFSLKLDEFGVKRPKLLLRPISNEIRLEGQLVAALSAGS